MNLRRRLMQVGYAPHEADAQLAIAQCHLSDFRRGGGHA